jgi:hypothetical protein
MEENSSNFSQNSLIVFFKEWLLFHHTPKWGILEVSKITFSGTWGN